MNDGMTYELFMKRAKHYLEKMDQHPTGVLGNFYRNAMQRHLDKYGYLSPSDAINFRKSLDTPDTLSGEVKNK